MSPQASGSKGKSALFSLDQKCAPRLTASQKRAEQKIFFPEKKKVVSEGVKAESKKAECPFAPVNAGKEVNTKVSEQGKSRSLATEQHTKEVMPVG